MDDGDNSATEFRERYVGVDNSKSPPVPRVPVRPQQPKQPDRPTSSLSMLLARKLLPKRNSPPIQSIPTPNNQFSCQTLLETVTKFHENGVKSSNGAMAPSPLMLESLRLYAAEDDGTPDFELPQFDRSSNVMSVGVQEFAVVDSSRNSQVMHIRVSSESAESYLDDQYDDSFSTEVSEEPDVVSHYVVECENGLTDVISDEDITPRCFSDDGDSDQPRAQSSNYNTSSSPPLPHPIIGAWLSSPPSAGTASEDYRYKSKGSSMRSPLLSNNKEQSSLKPSIPSTNSISSMSSNNNNSNNNSNNKAATTRSSNYAATNSNATGNNTENFIISCRVAGSSTWSVAGRVSLDRLSLQSFDNTEFDATAQEKHPGATRGSVASTRSRQSSTTNQYPTFLTSHIDAGEDEEDYYVSRPRRVLTSYVDSESDEDDDSFRAERSSSTMGVSAGMTGNGGRVISTDYSLALPSSLGHPHHSGSPSSPSDMQGFFGDMSPPDTARSAPMVRNIDTGELISAVDAINVITAPATTVTQHSSNHNHNNNYEDNDGDDFYQAPPDTVTFVTPAMLYGKR